MTKIERGILNILSSSDVSGQTELIKTAISLLPPDKAEKYRKRLTTINAGKQGE